MRPILDFFVAGEPKAQPRPKATARGKFVRIYTPSTADDWKNAVRARAKLALMDLGVEGLIPPHVPLFAVAVFRFPRPKSHWVGGRPGGKLKPTAPTWHTQTPDADNLLKAVLDALGRFQDAPRLVWTDDAQVAYPPPLKFFATHDPPGLHFTLWELPSNMDPADLLDPSTLTPGEALDIERRRAGLNRQEFAALLGVSPYVVRSWLEDVTPKRFPQPKIQLDSLTAVETLIVLRLREGWTVKELAYRTQLAYSWLSKVERGEVQDVEPLLVFWHRLKAKVAELEADDAEGLLD
jgi:Holliday junction resolvase RusA-like endonuclease